MINMKGLSKAHILAALYNRSQCVGMGILNYDPKKMNYDDAMEIIIHQGGGLFGHLYFDYIKGRVMKVDLSKDEFDEWLYDRDNGNGAALNALVNAGLIKPKEATK